jgi:endogenous inhibitor of DNA gyrase (YacG/DUF329 family)
MTEPKCPICSKPRVAAFQPFCSGRCRDVDLHRWLSESYRIPAGSADETDDEEPPPAA